jgi:hypothetical protein
MAYISQITVPSGTTYNIKDTSAWNKLAIHDTSIVNLYSIINQGSLVIVKVNELPDASANGLGKLYLVPCNDHDPSISDIFDEYVIVTGGTSTTPSYSWEKIGNTDVNLSNYATLSHWHNVTGTAESAGGHSHTISPTKKYLVAQNNVPLTFTSANFVTGVSTSKLVTTSITAVNGSSTASHASAGTAVNVAKPGTEKAYSKITSNSAGTVTVTCVSANTATGALGDVTTNQSANTPMWGAQVSGEVLSFTFKPLTTDKRVTSATATTTATVTAYSNSSITGINGSVSYTPYTFTDVTVPNASTVTVATGQVSSSGSGSSVATGSNGSSSAFTGINSSVSLIKNVAPSTTASNVQVVTNVTGTESGGAHTHTLNASTGAAQEP